MHDTSKCFDVECVSLARIMALVLLLWKPQQKSHGQFSTLGNIYSHHQDPLEIRSYTKKRFFTQTQSSLAFFISTNLQPSQSSITYMNTRKQGLSSGVITAVVFIFITITSFLACIICPLLYQHCICTFLETQF